MTSASRARVDCQWNAKPRISTTKPVVVDSVTVSAVSERHSASACVLGIDDGELAERAAEVAHRHDRGGAVRQRRLQGAGAGPEAW